MGQFISAVVVHAANIKNLYHEQQKNTRKKTLRKTCGYNILNLTLFYRNKRKL